MRFYGTMNNGGKAATKGGTAKTGLSGHLRGWNIGAEVSLSVDKDNNDQIEINITRGSENPTTAKRLGTFTLKDI